MINQGEKTTIRYWVICGKHSRYDVLQSFNHTERAPPSFCKLHVDNGPRLEPKELGIIHVHDRAPKS